MSRNKPEDHDLIGRMASFMDLHMMFPLIQYLQSKDIYVQDDLNFAMLEIVRPTLMFDYMLELMGDEANDPAVVEEVNRKRDETVADLEELTAFISPLLNLVQDQASLMMVGGAFTMENLSSEHDITEDMISAYERFGKMSYETGSYLETIDVMKFCFELTHNNENLWGKLAAESITLKTTDDVVAAVADIEFLADRIEKGEDNNSENYHLEQLQRRSWLLHWSLFTFFKSDIQESQDPDPSLRENGAPILAKDFPKYLKAKMIEVFLNPKNLNSIQTNCPHLLRYLSVMLICSDKKTNRKNLQTLIKVIQQEQYNYRDPITSFVECLLVSFDFDSAQERLRECEMVLSNDYFLEHMKDEFIESAKKAIFDIYCRIHTKIDTTMLSSRLGMAPEEAELWIVNLIRDARLDAKIDSEQNCVIMGQHYPEIYQQIIDKSKDLTLRSYQLVNDVKAEQQQS